MGGIHFIPSVVGTIVLVLWQQKFLAWIQQGLVSFDNLSDSINNSDLELTGSIAHNDILVQLANICERTIHNFYDSIATVFWQRKDYMTTTGPTADLLGLQAFHQHYFYVPLNDYIPGNANKMTNILSRQWDLSDTDLLTLFNSEFPQELPWHKCHLSKMMFSGLILALSR